MGFFFTPHPLHSCVFRIRTCVWRAIYLNHLFGWPLRKHHRSHNSLYQCFNWDEHNSWAIMKGLGLAATPCSTSLISCCGAGSRLEICLSQTTTMEAYSIFMSSCGPTMCWAVALLFHHAYTGKTAAAEGADVTDCILESFTNLVAWRSFYCHITTNGALTVAFRKNPFENWTILPTWHIGNVI